MMKKDCLTQLPLLQLSKIFKAFDPVWFIYMRNTYFNSQHFLQQSAFSSTGDFWLHFYKISSLCINKSYSLSLTMHSYFFHFFCVKLGK